MAKLPMSTVPIPTAIRVSYILGPEIEYVPIHIAALTSSTLAMAAPRPFAWANIVIADELIVPLLPLANAYVILRKVLPGLMVVAKLAPYLPAELNAVEAGPIAMLAVPSAPLAMP